MASKELRLTHSDSSSDSSSDDEEQDTSMEDVQQNSSMEEDAQDSATEEDSPKSLPPKKKIKLSIRMPKSTEKMKVVSTESTETTLAAPEKDDNDTPTKLKADAKVAAAQATPTANKTVADSPREPSSNGETSNAKTDSGKKDSTPSDKNDDDTESDESVVQAIVVDSSAANDKSGAKPAAVATIKPFKAPKPNPVARSISATKRRSVSRPALPTSGRAVRFPPFSSPGMLIPPSAGVFRGGADANGFSTPASVFDHCMALAGYNTKARTENPHRGSSVQREVGDMFDSDVSLALNFPSLVPKGIWSMPGKRSEPSKDTATNAEETEEKKEEDTGAQRDAAQLLLRSLAPLKSTDEQPGQTAANGDTTPANGDTTPSRKRRRPWQFTDMAPLSLTLEFPDSYVQKRMRYVEEVKERERAIVTSQEANEKYEDAQERFILLSNAKRTTESVPEPPVRPEPIKIPPIPEPVSPPRLSEMKGLKLDGEVDDSKHPVYIPKTHEAYTAHLDPSCFHITNGRYFNIMSNSIADPTFVGPNAPGIAGLNLAGGSGLATAYAGSTTGSAAALKEAYYGSINGKKDGADLKDSKASGTKNKSSTKKKSSGTPSSKKNSADSAGKVETLYRGPTPTSTSTALKRLMDAGDDAAQQMRDTIRRAAVYASRTDNSTMSFQGSNGEVYADISKAFAAHAGIRPCNRCKNNKQGAYHCRLRRKHKDLDYDGGDSPAALAPLFQEPLDELILGTK